VHHDALFKAAFEHPAHAAGLFRHHLPAALANAIDWSTLALEPGSYVDETLGRSHSDLLFSARIGNRKIVLYVLLEHQSCNDPEMPYRVLRYLMRIWERHVDRHGHPLPLIVTLVISHAPGGWTAPVHLHDLFSPTPASLEDTARYVPGFEIIVEDLAHVTNEELEARALETFPELVLRALRDARDIEQLDRNIADLARLAGKLLVAPSGIAAVSQILRYIAQVCEGLHYDDFCAKLREHLPEAERPAMTVAEELMQKGRAEGREAGRAEGQITLLVKLLTRKFGDLPAEYRARLEAATSELLERYAERLLVAGTLAAVFADD
jgi:predicted transposase/invertase (TIGR01784 family)